MQTSPAAAQQLSFGYERARPRKRRAGTALIVALACAVPVLTTQHAASAVTGALPSSNRYVAGQVLVGFRPDSSPTRESGSSPRVLKVAPNRVATTIAALRRRRDVRYAEPNFIARATVTPDDAIYPQQYAMTKIGAPLAWDNTTGDGSAVVGVLDTGIDALHPELAANMWRNDGTLWGCAANTTGYDVVNNDCDAADDNFHGTHVAGTIGAVGNNAAGVAGVNWHVKLMSLKVLDNSGAGTYLGIINAIDRAIAAKQAGVNIRVLTASLGATASSSALQDAINRATAADILFVTAAGNLGADLETTPFYPCVYAAICVAATDSTDARASFSNYGTTTVDIAAPGVGIVSTSPGGGYRTLNGTSMATPHVAGAVALLAQNANCKTLSASDLTSRILGSAGTVAGLAVAANRRLNVGRAIASCADPNLAVPSLTSGVAVAQLAGSIGSQRFFKLTVPAAQSKLVFETSRGIGNADLYLRRGDRPTTTTYSCRGITSDNGDKCEFDPPAAGVYYVMIYGTKAYQGLRLKAWYRT